MERPKKKKGLKKAIRKIDSAAKKAKKIVSKEETAPPRRKEGGKRKALKKVMKLDCTHRGKTVG